MPIYILDDDFTFPHPSLADKDGLLAVGGDLSPGRLLTAYANGIFPWFDKDSPILWWSTDPRMILLPQNFIRSHSLIQTFKKGKFEVRFDEAFENVISHCAGTQRKGEDGTWITPDMIAAYVELHKLGYAHSVESYLDGKLAGGLYGISLGKAFFGESMFHIERDASKIALASLVDRMLEWDFHFIDAQQRTEHLRSLGAQAVPRNEYLEMLEKALTFSTRTGKW